MTRILYILNTRWNGEYYIRRPKPEPPKKIFGGKMKIKPMKMETPTVPFTFWTWEAVPAELEYEDLQVIFERVLNDLQKSSLNLAELEKKWRDEHHLGILLITTMVQYYTKSPKPTYIGFLQTVTWKIQTHKNRSPISFSSLLRKKEAQEI